MNIKVVKQIKTLSHRWLDSVRRVIPMILMFDRLPSEGSEYINSFITLLQHSLKHKGEIETIRVFKSYRVYLQQYALRQLVTPLPFRKTGSDGHPKVLKLWIDLIDLNLESRRTCMSIWRLVEMFRVSPDTNTDSITSPQKLENIAEANILFAEYKKWLKEWDGLKVLPEDLPETLIIASNKAGPNGPASACALADLTALKADKPLYDAVARKLSLSKTHFRLDKSSSTNGIFKHSKLGFSSDKAGKTRIFAIGDWWSNMALRDIHEAFMAGLKNLRGDVTYRQDEIPKLIKGLGKSVYTADMTAFTDRFPISWETEIVSAAYGLEIGNLWEHIIQKRDFWTPKGPVRYAVGNPMGLLSSWAVSSFTHHAVKQWCATRTYPKITKYKYLVLGDDSVDSDSRIYLEYLRVIQTIGVSINPGKCTQSQKGYAEFAKRLFTPECEITGLPVHLLQEVPRKPESFIELIRILRNRGYSENQIEPGVRSLLSKMPKKVSKVVLFVLSAPEELLGMPPLVFTSSGLYTIVNPPLWGASQVLSMKTHVEQARREIFWEEVDKLIQKIQKGTFNASPEKGERIIMPWDHPLRDLVVLKMSQYRNPDNRYSVYDKWMAGESYEMVNLPSVDNYRYRNRAHKASRSRYEILKRAKAFAEGTREYRTTLPERISNMSLYNLIQPFG